jgi:hypothetical protein
MIVGDKLPPMPSSKKKIKSKQSTSKGKLAVSKKETAHSKRVVTARIPKNVTKKPNAPKKMTSATVASPNKRTSVSAEREIKEEIKNRNLTTAGSASGRQSGDLQGLSRAEQANSESVDELVEEGNLFEAGAVAGVEEADSADEREVHTHELPEDDVPQEYLDKE